MSGDLKNIIFKKENDVAEIILNNPPVNIMTQAMMEEINSVLEELHADNSLHMLIFSSEGKHFSAGADVGEHTKDKCGEMIPEFTKLFFNLNKITCPVIAVVKGLALGGGCELVIFCDMVIASEKAKIGQPEISVGVFPPLGAVIFPHLLGRNRAMELLLSGDVIPAAEAERIGLINKVFPEEIFEEKTKEFLDKFKNKSPVVLKLTKKAIDASLYRTVIDALKNAEEIYLKELMETEDASEGISAFLEKRQPLWKGK
ncbi:enoyl-CoA hydratase/isomerase family protein [candidate division KSB1 bacterium]